MYNICITYLGAIMDLRNRTEAQSAYLFRAQTEIDSMVGMVSEDLGETIDIGHDNHLNVDSIVETTTPKLVLPGGYVPRIPNPLPQGPHPMLERAYAAHENRLARYSNTHVGPITPSVANVPTPQLLENRLTLRPFWIVFLETVAMFIFFIGKTVAEVIIYAPRTLAGSHTYKAEHVRHTVAHFTPHPTRQGSVMAEITRGIRYALTPYLIAIWAFVTTVLIMLQGYGVIHF